MIARAEVERFRAAIARRLGLHFDDGKLDQLAAVLERRAADVGERAAYLDGLERPERLGPAAARDELRHLARELTVGETYFFRNFDQFRAVAALAVPGSRLRMLSAGCASGEEPYSLVMLLADRGVELSVRAVDVNAAALERASLGRYSPWALRETPDEAQRRWFAPDGRELLLDAAIRAAVTFEERNLSADEPELWRPGSYDVIFCRNVMMYLEPEVARALVGRITRSLAPGGHLFVGHAETLRGLSADFHLRHTHGTFYYQRKDGPERPLSPAPSPVAIPLQPGWASTWVDTVQHAADRIRALSEQAPPVAEMTADAPRVTPSGPGELREPLDTALSLLKQERFAEALGSVERLAPRSARDPDVLLLRAVLLVHNGQLDAAEKVCAQLLEVDELNAGSHYVLALCREGAGDRAGAVDHDQISSHLDAGFVMPRLHLGLMARRAGDRDTARRELAQAVLLLPREDSSRLLLFGGGFSRDALIALCRAELEGVA